MIIARHNNYTQAMECIRPKAGNSPGTKVSKSIKLYFYYTDSESDTSIMIVHISMHQ